MHKIFGSIFSMLFIQAPATAETFVLPLEADAGFLVKTDWPDNASISELRISTGETSPPLAIGGDESLIRNSNSDGKKLLAEVFQDPEIAGRQVECQHFALVLLCRKAAGLAIKARSGNSRSESFIAKGDHIWCIDGLAGTGACSDTKPARIESRR